MQFKDCGELISKSTDETIIKYGTKTELYLNVQFEKQGFKSINVDETTYFKSKKGEYMCFLFDKEIENIKRINIIIGCIFLIIVSFISLVLFFIWLFDL